MRKQMLFALISLSVLAVSSASSISEFASNIEEVFLSNPTIFVPLALSLVIMAVVKFSVGNQSYDEKNSNMLAAASGIATFLIVMFAVPEQAMIEYARYSIYVIIVALVLILVAIIKKHFKDASLDKKLNSRWILFIVSVLCAIFGFFSSSIGLYSISGWSFVICILSLSLSIILMLWNATKK